MLENLKIKIFLAAAGVLVSISLAYAEDPFSGMGGMGVIRPKVRVEAPGFTLTSLRGGQRSLGEFKGKVILLNFWHTNCEPCKKEMPSMERLWKRLKDRGFVVITVAEDRGDTEKAGKFCKNHGITFPVLHDPEGEVMRTYEVALLPTSYLIGRDGKFLGKVVGERDWDETDALELFEGLLK